MCTWIWRCDPHPGYDLACPHPRAGGASVRGGYAGRPDDHVAGAPCCSQLGLPRGGQGRYKAGHIPRAVIRPAGSAGLGDRTEGEPCGDPEGRVPAQRSRGECRVSTVVVQRFCKPKVGGSNPSPGTKARPKTRKRAISKIRRMELPGLPVRASVTAPVPQIVAPQMAAAGTSLPAPSRIIGARLSG